MKQNTSKTSGIHKMRYGQLMTLNGHVYQCLKYRLDFCECVSCVFADISLFAESYIACKMCPPRGYFRKIK